MELTEELTKKYMRKNFVAYSLHVMAIKSGKIEVDRALARVMNILV